MRLYRSKDYVEVLCNHIEEEAKRLYHTSPEKPMEPLTPEHWREFGRTRECHICLECFESWDKAKVIDPCDDNGKYRGADHQKCNLRYAIPHYIPVVFHNLSSYDAHLFIRDLGKKFDSRSIGVIAENKEKHISFNVNVTIEKKSPLWVRKSGLWNGCNTLTVLSSCRAAWTHSLVIWLG